MCVCALTRHSAMPLRPSPFPIYYHTCLPTLAVVQQLLRALDSTGAALGGRVQGRSLVWPRLLWLLCSGSAAPCLTQALRCEAAMAAGKEFSSLRRWRWRRQLHSETNMPYLRTNMPYLEDKRGTLQGKGKKKFFISVSGYEKSGPCEVTCCCFATPAQWWWRMGQSMFNLSTDTLYAHDTSLG